MSAASSRARLPSLTVVTPSYNQTAYLEQAIRSVLGQGYPALEYLVLDGGSDDGSVAILRRHAARLAHWESAPDAGQADAIARGFARGGGEVLAWLNADDYYLPGALVRVGRFFARHPEAQWVVGGCDWVDAGGRYLRRQRALAQDFESLLCAGQRIAQPACFWRRAAYERAGGLDTALRFCFDYDLFLKLARQGPPGRIPRALAAYREHGSSKTATIWESVGREEAALVRARHRPADLREERCRRAAEETRAAIARERVRGALLDAVRDPAHLLRRGAAALGARRRGAGRAAGRR